MTIHRRFNLPVSQLVEEWKERRLLIRVWREALLIPIILFALSAISHSIWQALTFVPFVGPINQQMLDAASTSADGTKITSVNWQLVAKQNWFGRLDPVGSVKQPASVTLKEAPLPLILRGISTGRFPSAVIDASGNTQTYGKGDVLHQNNATLVDIQPDFVLLSINGQLERLSFPVDAEQARLLRVNRTPVYSQLGGLSVTQIAIQPQQTKSKQTSVAEQ